MFKLCFVLTWNLPKTCDKERMRRKLIMERILLVDDDVHILHTIESWLTPKGYEVLCARNMAQALNIAKSTALSCIVLDVYLPDGSGVELCERLRQTSRVPILFLSAYNQEDDRIRGLLAGGDDYLGKPFNLTELELRIRIRIDRYRGKETLGVLHFDDLEIDLDQRCVKYAGIHSNFSPLEFDLLAFLATHPGQVFSYEQLYDRVWNEPMNQGLHNLQMCMARVRQKLSALCPGQCYIETIRRKGYYWKNDNGENNTSD